MASLREARGSPISAVLIRGSWDAEVEAVPLQLRPADHLDEVGNLPVMQSLLLHRPITQRLIPMNFDQRTQILEATRVLIAHTPEQFNHQMYHDRRIRIVEIPKQRFLKRKWRELPLKLYGMCYLAADCSVRYPVAGMIFGLDIGRNILPCLSSSRSLASETAKAACHYYADEPVLVIMDMVREMECPPLIRMLKRARRVLG